MSTIQRLMSNDPPGFFTRGGRVLWDTISADLCCKPLPDDWATFESLFVKSFEKHTSHKIERTGHIYYKNLDTGGMSGGVVYPMFFKEVILKFLEYHYSGLTQDVYMTPYNHWIEKVNKGVI